MRHHYFIALYTVAVGVVLGAALPLSVHAALLSDHSAFVGETSGDSFGYSISAGDVNGDGYDDMLMGAYQADGVVSSAGAAYLAYGPIDFVTAVEGSATTSSIGDSTYVKFSGLTDSDYAGYSVASGGDVNGDGYDDILIGAPYEDSTFFTNSGAVYLVYGQAAALSSQRLDASNVIKFEGEGESNYLGRSVAFAGDINGDGYDDVLLGADGQQDVGANAGAAYVIYGQATSLSGVTLGTAASVTQLSGESSPAAAGYSVSGAGDVNGDGYDDFLVGSYGYANGSLIQAGAAYLVYGQSTHLSNASLSTTVRFAGDSASGYAGISVSGAGDVNGDGYADILIGASNRSGSAGSVYLIYGSATALTTQTLDAASVVRFRGAATGDQAGSAVATAGDVDGDGYSEFLIGALGAGDTIADSGMAYVMKGASAAYSNTLLSSVAGQVASIYEGTLAYDLVGQSVVAADTNADGFPELWVGAYSQDSAASNAGAVYAVAIVVDADGDGVGVTTTDTLFTGSDCDDADALVSTEQTYYADEDGDGLGDPEVSSSICAASAPTGYANNSSDTIDTVANNGVEINGDAVDNDGDGDVDEVNTKAENGRHPAYGSSSTSSTSVYAASVNDIAGAKDGRILVTYADNSVYQYDIFPKFTGKQKTIVLSYTETGLLAVLHPKGKKIKLVNAYNGTVLRTVQLSDQSFEKSSLKQFDLRGDGVNEFVVVSTDNGAVVLSVLKVKASTSKISLASQVTTPGAAVTPEKTQLKKKQVLLRSSGGSVVYRYAVSSDYALSLVTE